MKEQREELADFIEANFTPKGEAEKVTAKECYLRMLEVPDNPKRYLKLAERAYQAAKAFNEYKPDNDWFKNPLLG